MVTGLFDSHAEFKEGIPKRLARFAYDVFQKRIQFSLSANAGGTIDLIWINGENFRTAKQGGVLWGPFAEALPNVKHFSEDARRRDFGTNVEGYEAPYKRAQFVIAYDTARAPDPPRSIEKLREWIKTHPTALLIWPRPILPDRCSFVIFCCFT